MQCPPLVCCYFPSLSYSLPFSTLTLLCHLTHLILHVLYKSSLPFGYSHSALGSQDNIIITRPTLRAAKSRSLTVSDIDSLLYIRNAACCNVRAQLGDHTYQRCAHAVNCAPAKHPPPAHPGNATVLYEHFLGVV